MSNITNFNFNGADVRQSSQSAYRDIGFVYVVEDAATGRVKIGMSSKPEQRIRSVRSSAGKPVGVEVRLLAEGCLT